VERFGAWNGTLLGTHAVIWTTIGLTFGALAERNPGGPPEAMAAPRS
jgi:hypothetical protein